MKIIILVQVSLACNNVTLVFTSPGDDSDKAPPVLKYTIKYSKDLNIIDVSLFHKD